MSVRWLGSILVVWGNENYSIADFDPSELTVAFKVAIQ